jgi:FlaA1/EpsC-like NDP-sugar epimerase
VTGTEARRKSLLGLRSWLLDLPRRKKRAFLVVLDFIALSGVLWFGKSVGSRSLYIPPDSHTALLLLSGPVMTITTLACFGGYRVVTRYLGSHGQSRIMLSVALSVLGWWPLVLLSGDVAASHNVILLYGLVGTGVLILSRQMIGKLLGDGIVPPKSERNKKGPAVIIYGAGQAGVEFVRAVAKLPGYAIVGFCDLSPTLWGQYVSGIKVYRPDRLAGVIKQFGVKQVLLAIPANARNERRMVMKELEQLAVEVKVLPSLEDIVSGRIDVTALRPLDVEDLLSRNGIPPIVDLLARNTRNKCVLVTGAGGSVGSELARQVIRQGPCRLILLDVSEAALYNIDIELQDALTALPDGTPPPEIISVLGSVVDRSLMLDTLRRHAVDTIYHAAACKHVPIVEDNAVVGLENNVFGTDVVAAAALESNVERVVLISTDKVVRPTSVMGASKRLSELVFQARATEDAATTFTIVRFGNVLDSSGSVVERFRGQIKRGGPVTVTHPEVMRHFVSIAEAVELIIQAGAIAKAGTKGGEIFAIDMGEPVKIDGLARLMVRLSGLEIRDRAHPDGDIEITYTGLRPGEKLCEELSISASMASTDHPRILRLDEPAIDPVDLERELDLLRAAMRIRDVATIQAVLMRTVEGYRADSDVRATKGISVASWVSPSRMLH